MHAGEKGKAPCWLCFHVFLQMFVDSLMWKSLNKMLVYLCEVFLKFGLFLELERHRGKRELSNIFYLV